LFFQARFHKSSRLLLSNLCGFQTPLPINKHTPTLSTPPSFPTNTSLKFSLRILQPLLIKATRLQPYCGNSSLLGFTEDLLCYCWLRDYAERGLGGVGECGRRGDGGVGGCLDGYGGAGGRYGRGGEGVRVVPVKDWGLLLSAERSSDGFKGESTFVAEFVRGLTCACQTSRVSIPRSPKLWGKFDLRRRNTWRKRMSWPLPPSLVKIKYGVFSRDMALGLSIKTRLQSDVWRGQSRCLKRGQSECLLLDPQCC